MEAERTLLVDVGGDLNHRSTTATTNVDLSHFKRSETSLARKALFHVKGEDGRLQVNANNMQIQGADIINDGTGETSINAKNALNLTALSVGYDEKLGKGNHYRNEKVENAVVSTVKGKGDVTLTAKNILSEGAELESEARLTAIAENDLVLASAQNMKYLEEYHKTKKRRVLSSSQHENYLQDEQGYHTVSQLKGNEIEINAGHNIEFNGTQGNAIESFVAWAGGNIHLNAVKNTQTHTSWEKHKKSGFTGSYQHGVWRGGYASERSESDGKSQSQTHRLTSFNVQQGDILLNAKNRLTLNAAQLNGDNITLEGSDVRLNAVIDTFDGEQHHRTKSWGVGGRLTVDSHALKKQEYANESANGSSHTLVGKIFNFTEAVDKSTHQMMNGAANYAYAQQTESHHYQHREQAQVNDINAKGHLKIHARDNDIQAEGGMFNAGKSATFEAKNHVTLDAAETWQTDESHSRRKGMDRDTSQRADGQFGVYHNKEQGESFVRTQQGVVITAGEGSHIQTTDGNVTGVGVSIISEGDNVISAGQNVRLTTAQIQQHQADERTNRGIGSARISDTERFYGYHRELGDHLQDDISHSGSLMTSLNGNVVINAGNDYHQTSSQVLAKEKIIVNANQITADTAFDEQRFDSHESDLKVGNFTRVKSPIIDLLNTIESAVKNKDASDRLKAANAMSIAAQGYNLSELSFDPSQWQFDKNPMDAGYIFRVETGTGFSHSRDNRQGWEKSSVANRFNAKEIELNANAGKVKLNHTDLTSRDETGARMQDSRVILYGRDGIDYQGGEDSRYYKGRQQNSGVEVGTAFSVGAKMGWSFYLQAGFGNSKQDAEGQIVHNSQVDTARLELKTGEKNDTATQTPAQRYHQSHVNISGVSAKAGDILTDIDGNLTLESRQSHIKESSRNGGMNFHVEGGFGTSWDASGNVSMSRGNSERHQVLEQTGLFAENTYDINADNIHLKGAAITSQDAKHSHIKTNHLTFENIENYSSSQAASAGFSAGYGKTENQAKAHYSPSLPQLEQQHDKTITKATLTEGNITLNKDTHPTQITVKDLGINTDITQANAQTEAPKDINKALSEQQQIAQAASHVQSAVETYTENRRAQAQQEVDILQAQLDKAKQQGNQAAADSIQEKLSQAKADAESWGTGGSTKRAIDSVTAVTLTLLSGGSPQAIAAAGASPYINEAIKKATEDYPALNLPAHILWGAIEAEMLGGNATTGAVSTAAGELGAKYLAEHFYQKDVKDLTETERQQIKEASKALAGIAGGLTAAGQSADSVKILRESAVGTTVTKNAVENNYLRADKAKELFEIENRIRLGIATENDLARQAELKKEDKENDQKVIDACRGSVTTSACQQEVALAQAARESYNAYYPNGTWQSYKNILPDNVSSIDTLLYDKEGVALAFEQQVEAIAKARNLSLDDARTVAKALNYYHLAAGTMAGAYGVMKSGNFATKVPDEIDSSKKLPPVGETTGYDTKSFNYEAHNLVNYEKYKAQLVQENFINIANQDPILRKVYDGLGKNINYGIDTILSSSESNKLGLLWVGENYSIVRDKTGSVIGSNSQDRLRGYRVPSSKDSPFATTGFQANFETYEINSITNDKIKVGNAHVNIKD